MKWDYLEGFCEVCNEKKPVFTPHGKDFKGICFECVQKIKEAR